MKKIITQFLIINSSLFIANIVSYSQAWEDLNTPSLTTGVGAIAIDGSNVYSGGSFTVNFSVGSFGRYDGSNWNLVGDWYDYPNGLGTINVAKKIDNYIYVGGYFTDGAGVVGLNKIGRWNITTQTWEAMGNGITTSGTVYDIVKHNNEIIIAGNFTDANGDPNADGLLKWNGTSWTALSSTSISNSSSLSVNALSTYGTSLYVGGNFQQGIVEWDGTSFLSVGGWDIDNVSIDQGAVISMAIDQSNGNIYVGGEGTATLSKWDGASWTSLASSSSSVIRVYAIGVIGNKVYFGGDFQDVAGIPNTTYIAMYDGSIHSVAGGLNDKVYRITPDGNNFYVGGNFTNAGGNTSANKIARFNSTGTASIDEVLKNFEFSLYPNPTNSWLNISVSESSDITIFNLLGEEIAQQHLTEGTNKVDTRNFENGVYIVQNSNGEVLKFVKE